MIQREHYLAQVRPFLESDLIKILTGIRRCGKSVLLKQIETELILAGKRTLALNFEDQQISRRIRTSEALVDYIESHLGPEKLYVFLDEIQQVDCWSEACRSLRLRNLSLFITGSNSKLLSKEFTKELSGRYVSFQIRPFVFQELQAYAHELNREISVTDYLVFGGFPKTMEFEEKEALLRYLNDLDQTIVLNDIMNRYSIKRKELFHRLVDYVMVSNARIFSANSIRNYLKTEAINCSPDTIIKYLGYLEESYAISSIPQYSQKAKRHLRYYTKLYDADVAFNSIRQPEGRYDLTHNLENVVYNELLFRGYELSVFVVDGGEIDFLATKNNKAYLVQVVYSVADEKTYRREFALFNKLDQSRQKVLITADDVDFSTSTVRHIPLKEFLLASDF